MRRLKHLLFLLIVVLKTIPDFTTTGESNPG